MASDLSFLSFLVIVILLLNIAGLSTADKPLPCTSNPNCMCFKGTLSCSGNAAAKVTTLPELTSATDITTFMCNDCSLGNVGRIPYPSVTTIFFENSGIVAFSNDSFVGLPNLQVLAIRTNSKLLSFSRTTFAPLTNLTSLDLTGNGITDLPAGFLDSFPQLLDLDLTKNPLMQLDSLRADSLSRVPLTKFHCDGCALTAIPTNFLSGCNNLVELSLTHNNFTSIDDGAFPAALTSLRTLNLDSSLVVTISSGAFQNLTSVTSLWLGNNMIAQLRDGTLKPMWTTLTTLHLQGNQLSTIIEDRAPWTKLQEVKLGNNQWVCDCRIAWMHNLDQVDHDNLTCTTPAKVAGKNLLQIEKEMICESSSAGIIPAGRGRMSVVLAISIPVIFICLSMIGYYVWQIIRNRQQRAQQRHSFKYRSVYGETVESNTNSKQEIMT